MNNPLYRKHILSISDLSRSDLELIIQTAAIIKHSEQSRFLENKVVASCFFEASTRTRLSFETAIHRQGGSVIGFADSGSTSLAKKGETLSDSIKMLSGYADAIIMRHPQEGAARLASEVSNKPVINGGDGSNQHPTQTLLDLFTIHECQQRLDNLTITFVGDLKYGRTVHSLVQALSHFHCHFNFVAPDALYLPEYLLEELEEKNVSFKRVEAFEAVIPETDIIYMTRVQKERFDPTEYMHIASQYVLNVSMLQQAKDSMRILHPLPRVDEIELSVDETPYAYYFEQAKNGVYARQALLALVLNETVEET